jgi:hypothetical protein
MVGKKVNDFPSLSSPFTPSFMRLLSDRYGPFEKKLVRN